MKRNIIFYIFIFVCPFSLFSQVNAEQVLSIGKNVLSMEDYMLSIQYFNQAIKAKPYLSEAYFFRGLAKLYLEDYRGAEEDCSLALERNKFRTEAYKVRGFARQAMGLDSLAIEDYNFGLQYAPMDKYFMFYKAVAQTELSRYEDAQKTYASLLRAYPKFEDGYSGRAQLYLAMKDTTRALGDINKAVEISKNIVNPYLMRADIYSKQHNWDKALEDMETVIRLSPQEADYYVNRAYLRYNLDDYFGAMSDYNYAIELEPFNTAAIFNRGLLRYEVMDLEKAETDFTTVLEWDATNFHARYNRGLIRLDLNKHKEALADFNDIAKRYPRFYPIYYAIAQAQYGLGNQRAYFENIRKGDSLVEGYVKNPEKNPLEKPTIATGRSNDKGVNQGSDESELDVMNRFNQLVTVNENQESRLSYNDKIKGRVQDRNVRVEPEPIYGLTYYDSASELRSLSNYFRELDDLNQSGYLDRTIYLSNEIVTPGDEAEINRLFAYIENYTSIIGSSRCRPVDYFGRGINYLMLKDYDDAIADLDKAIEMNGMFTVAYMARAYAKQCRLEMNELISQSEQKSNEEIAMLGNQGRNLAISEIIADYDKAIELNSRLIYAWYNKGNLLLKINDLTSALNCYTEAIRINPEFGQAYYNRGLVYLQLGNKANGISDLSKAGELGVLPSYNVLKRMK